MQLHTGKLISVVMAVLVVSVGVNVLQAQRILFLVSRPSTESPVVGKQVPSFLGISPDGQPVDVSFRGSLPTVLYHFSSSCGWCERNWRNIEAVAAGAAGRYRVLAVTTETGIKSYVQQRGILVDIVEQIGPDIERLLHLAGTPKTFAIGADGIVTHEWLGAYQNRTARQIEELFGVRLPGIIPSVPGDRPN